MLDIIEKCYNYDIKWYDFIIPTKQIMLKSCTSIDKTTMFIVGFVRAALFLCIGKLYYDYFELSTIRIIILIAILLYALFNIVVMVFIILKRPKMTAYTIDSIVKGSANLNSNNPNNQDILSSADIYPE